MENFYKALLKRVGLRFTRGFIAGALSAVALVSIGDISSWGELSLAFYNLIFAVFSGGITGGFMALDKWVREKKKGLDK